MARACRRLAAPAAVALVALALASAAAAGGPFIAPGAPLAGHPRVALLPLEDFSGRADAGELATRILRAELTRIDLCEVVEQGDVDQAIEELHLRNTGSLSSEQARQLAERLHAPLLMMGTLLESGTVRTPSGDVPAAALSLRLVEAAANRVVWADMLARTGEDKETLFGWGREYDANKLTQQLVVALLRTMPELVRGRPGATGPTARTALRPPARAPGGGIPADSSKTDSTGGTP